MKNSGINWDDWQAEIYNLRLKQADMIPLGWITIEQFAAHSKNNITASSARKVLSDLVGAGVAERKKFNVVIGDIGVRPIWHYKLKK